jgi:hypothetical protein
MFGGQQQPLPASSTHNPLPPPGINNANTGGGAGVGVGNGGRPPNGIGGRSKAGEDAPNECFTNWEPLKVTCFGVF